MTSAVGILNTDLGNSFTRNWLQPIIVPISMMIPGPGREAPGAEITCCYFVTESITWRMQG